MRVTQMIALPQGRRHAWVKMTSHGEIGKRSLLEFFCLCKHSSALEDCEVHKPCGAQDHSKAVTGKEIKSGFPLQGKGGKHILEREVVEMGGKEIS